MRRTLGGRLGTVRIRPVRLGKVGNLYVPEGCSERVVELLEPVRGCSYALIRPCNPVPMGDGTYIVKEAMVICLLPEPW